MRATISLNGSASPSPASQYIGWAPSPCRIQLVDPTGATGPLVVSLRNQRTNVGGQVVFYTRAGNDFTAPSDTLQLTLSLDGSPSECYIGGRFENPSVADKDAAVEVITSSGTVIGVTQLMVRVRKNAVTLSEAERNRFIAAMATLNNRGQGRFRDLRDMHTARADSEAHGDAGFLPWHRAYLLDLERELQSIDPSVTLPYWRFDEPAAPLFSMDFLGESNANGRVVFTPGNPLEFWRTDNGDGITRTPRFNITQRSPGLLTEQETILLGESYLDFSNLEFNPHGGAHLSFTGDIRFPGTAPKDPLFFMLHVNVDRLWAKWQWVNRHYRTPNANTFQDSPAGRIGHKLRDTMWPWNQDIQPPRPDTAPGGALATSSCATAPGAAPTVQQMIDYQGLLNPIDRLGFDYDDVPFIPASSAPVA